VHRFELEGKTAGCGRPGGLPLILRFSRRPGWQPVGDPVNLLSRGETLILVNLRNPGQFTRIAKSMRWSSQEIDLSR